MKTTTSPKPWGRIAIIAIICIALIAFAIYNAIVNEQFWNASAINIVTVFIGIVISFFLVQRKNDERKQKDILLDLILKLQLQVCDEKTYDLSGQTQAEITMRNRDISNKIQILKDTADIFSTQSDVDFVASKFEEYLEFIGNHINELDYLSRSQKDLKRPLDLINNKLFSMAISLYK